jgi:hypothetical protein
MTVNVRPIEQLSFEGFEPLDKKDRKEIYDKVSELLREYYIMKEMRIKSLEAKRHQVIALAGDTREVNLKIQITQQSIARIEIALHSCTAEQLLLLRTNYMTTEEKKCATVRRELGMSKKIYDKVKFRAVFNFASAYGLII